MPDPLTSIPSSLRILMVAPTPFFADRGCHVRIYEEARTLKELGHDVRIVTYHLGRDMPGISIRRTPAIAWYKKLTAGPSWHKPYLDILLFFTALQEARSFNPHLIHAHLHEGALVGLLLKKILCLPLLFDCQGSLTAESVDHGFMTPGSLLFKGFSILERFINRSVDHILTSSGTGAEALQKEWDVPANRVLSLIDGVNCNEFRPLDPEECRRMLKLPEDAVIAVFLGVLNRYQGIDLLLEVARILRERGSKIHFLVMGFPEEIYRLLAEEQGLAASVTFTGRIDYSEAARYLCAGHLAVSPKISLTEANGKLFNYMACGLPTVVFDTPVNHEILGDTGVYAKFGDAGDLADKIELLASDLQLRERLSHAVVEKARTEHSWEARGADLVKVYRRLLTSQSG